MKKWKWNDVELDIRMSDVSFQEKYENAFKEMEQTELTLQKTGKLSELTKGYCQMFYDFFDAVYGKGTSGKLFEGRMDMEEVNEAYDSWLALCKEDSEAVIKKQAARFKKYKVVNKK